MNKFIITQKDPDPYKGRILNFWEKYLPETPAGRFEWMNHENPAGSAIWFFALEEGTNDLVGTVSVMPRRIEIMGKGHLAGIVGDFMIEERYRAFGPALNLMKIVVRDFSELGFTFLYTLPNEAAHKVCLRAGFREIGLLKTLTKPLNTKSYLVKHIHPLLANIFSPGLDFALTLFSRETYMKTNISFDQMTEPFSEYDIFFGKIRGRFQILGDRSREYLKWRYFNNPIYKFNIFNYRLNSNNSMSGYIIFMEINGNAFIFDILADESEVFKNVLGKYLKDLKKRGYSSVSIRVLQNNPFGSHIKRFGFIDRKEDFPLLFIGDSDFSSKEWVFFDGDRNI